MVTLQRDIREDDVEAWVTAIRMLQGVESVTLIKADPWNDYMIEQRTIDRLKARIDSIFRDVRDNGLGPIER